MDIGIEKAVKAAGNMAKLARSLGLTRSAIHQWAKIPAERVVEIEIATGVPRRELRPDLYTSPPSSPPATAGAPDAVPAEPAQ